jgi:hypothetical protein
MPRKADQVPAAGTLAGPRAPPPAPRPIAVRVAAPVVAVQEVPTRRVHPAGPQDTAAVPAAAQADIAGPSRRAAATTEDSTPPALVLPVHLRPTVVRLIPAPEIPMPVRARLFQVDLHVRICAKQVLSQGRGAVKGRLYFPVRVLNHRLLLCGTSGCSSL